jgi:hypothetical protein
VLAPVSSSPLPTPTTKDETISIQTCLHHGCRRKKDHDFNCSNFIDLSLFTIDPTLMAIEAITTKNAEYGLQRSRKKPPVIKYRFEFVTWIEHIKLLLPKKAPLKFLLIGL